MPPWNPISDRQSTQASSNARMTNVDMQTTLTLMPHTTLLLGQQGSSECRPKARDSSMGLLPCAPLTRHESKCRRERQKRAWSLTRYIIPESHLHPFGMHAPTGNRRNSLRAAPTYGIAPARRARPWIPYGPSERSGRAPQSGQGSWQACMSVITRPHMGHLLILTTQNPAKYIQA